MSERLFLHISLLVTLLVLDPACGNHASSQCVQVGQANANVARYDLDLTNTENNGILNGKPNPYGPFSIGAKNFETNFYFLDFMTNDAENSWDPNVIDCPYILESGKSQYADPCPPDDLVQIRTYAVKQDGKVMPGWLQFEVELMDKTDSILGIYVQVRDEKFNAVGEFVERMEEQCPQASTGVEFATPSPYQVLPCSAIGVREARLASAIFMVNETILRNKSASVLMSKDSINRGVHFTWRMSEYWCNRHLRIRPEAIILTEKVRQCGTKRPQNNQGIAACRGPPSQPRIPWIRRKAAEYWINHGFYGAADIKLPNTKLSCSQHAIHYNNGSLGREADGLLVAPWLIGVEKSTLDNDYLHPNNTEEFDGVPSFRSCQINIRTQWNKNEKQTIKDYILPTFGGRCLSDDLKNTTHEFLQQCELDPTAPQYEDVFKKYPDMPIYANYTIELQVNRSKYCEVTCQVPTAANLSAILNYTDRTGETNFTSRVKYSSDSRQGNRVEKFFIGRTYHGVLGVWVGFFFIPVTIFCARYFKETCMHLECGGAHLWIWIHLAATVVALCLFISSITGLLGTINTWGRTLHPVGVAHRVIGYVGTSMFSLLLMSGALRARNVKMRLVMATSHSVMGFLVHYMNIVCVVLSCFIPASPSMSDCDEEGNSKGFSALFFVAILFTLMDMGANLGMSVLQVIMDRQAGMRRPWYCPIIPVLPRDAKTDYVGAPIRKIAMLAFAAITFILTNIAMGLITGSGLSEECRALLGETTCKEPYGCSGLAISFAKDVVRRNEEKVTQGKY